MTETRRPGRPRSTQADAAILSTTLELLAEEGLRGLTFERVAARAGVSRATVYRRFRSGRDLAAAALGTLAPPAPPPEVARRSARDAFLAVAQERVAAAPTTRWNLLMPRLLVESAGDPEFHELVRRVLVDPARAVVAGIVRSGVERGELPSDLDPELGVDVLIGPIVYRVLIDGGDVAALPTRAARLFDLLAAAADVPGREPSR